MVDMVIKQREAYAISSFSYGCSGVPSELPLFSQQFLSVVAGFHSFAPLFFAKPPAFFLFLPTLRDFLT